MSTVHQEFLLVQELIAQGPGAVSVGKIKATLRSDGSVAFFMAGSPCRLPIRAFVRLACR